jgi:predicted nucleotidyltransferase
MKKNPNIDMLEIVAQGLGALCDDVVFVGGSVTAFYLDDPAATDIRPTNDVDCVIELAARKDYHKLEAKLRALGFEHQIDSLICRWRFRGILVDVMTTDGTILGFTNQWYVDGIRDRAHVQLPSGREISIFTLPYFIASKFEAFKDRGGNNYRLSHDLEDIVTVLDGSANEDIFAKAPAKLLSYLKKEFSKFLKNDQFEESLYGHISRAGDAEGRVQRLMRILQQFCSP